MIILTDHEAFSEVFRELYTRGMKLTSEASAYFCNEGKQTSAGSRKQEVAIFYTEEIKQSNRCLMQIASWLLLERASREQDMPTEILEREKKKIALNANPFRYNHPLWSELPERFRSLSEQISHFIERIHYMDQKTLSFMNLAQSSNPVNEQLLRLKNAFDIQQKA